jgi:phosphomannomutase
MDLESAERQGLLTGFDPIDAYVAYVMQGGKGNKRIAINTERMREHFKDSTVVIDEMHGAGRGYMSRILGEIGIRFSIIHGQIDPHIRALPYANPEEPYIDALKAAVIERGATLGVATDTDADRFGLVDRGGRYFRPNQLLPMLVRYLGVDRKLTGRIGVTVTGSPLIEQLASQMPHNHEFEPDSDVAPALVRHPFYQLKVGSLHMRSGSSVFSVMVGVKYLEEIRRMDARYNALSTLPDHWRDLVLVAGEESSGAIFRGHVTDKDGIFANLLLMDMAAYYGQEKNLNSVEEIWQDTCRLPGLWVSYGCGRPDEPNSYTGRIDVDAVLEAKEELLSYFLDYLAEASESNEPRLGSFEIVFGGGIRYDLVEIQLRDSHDDPRHFLRIRSSGTEPLIRIYVESSSIEAAHELCEMVLRKLDELACLHVSRSQTVWRLASVLTYSWPSSQMVDAVHEVLTRRGWQISDLIARLDKMESEVEARNAMVIREWKARLREV